MCNPVAIPIAAMVVTVGIAVAQGIAANKAANTEYESQQAHQNAQVAARDQQIKENYGRAMQSYRLNLVSEGVRMEEVRRAASQQTFNVGQAGLKARASANAAAASAGSAGQSTYLTLTDFLTQTGAYNNAIQRQYTAEQGQSDRNKAALHQQAKDRAAGIMPYIPAPVQQPSPIGNFLQIGATAVNAFGTYAYPYIQAQQQASTTTS